MYAVQRGQEELVRILLSHGADKYIMNRQNDNCIDLAVLLEKKRIENILNNRGELCNHSRNRNRGNEKT